MLGIAAAPAMAQTPLPPPITSENVSWVKNIAYEKQNGTTVPGGTDIEFTKIGGREYALAGSYRNGLQIVDITVPEKASVVSSYECNVTQGDVQVFRQADEPGRTFVTYTSDTQGDADSPCYQEAAALGFDVRKPNASGANDGRNGTFILEITDPANPTTLSFVEFEQGSHNMTVHPGGEWLYNSNSDLMTSFEPAIEFVNISNPSEPDVKNRGELPLPTRPGLGTESHDITFNKTGTRAYSAALSQGVIIDTTDPGKPSVITSFLNPAINVWHQSDPFTLTDASGQKRDFLMVEDEYAGAAAGGQCPNGGVWFYEITGELEKSPLLVGYFNIDEVRATDQPVLGRCTAHVFDVHEKAKIATIAWYNAGSRVLDLSGLLGIGIGGVGTGVKEIGFGRFTGGDTWSAKTPGIGLGSGDFYLYANDQRRGLDIWKFDGDARKPPKEKQGKWMSGSEAQSYFAAQNTKLEPGYQLFCLTGGDS
jgi:hypothetical protein